MTRTAPSMAARCAALALAAAAACTGGSSPAPERIAAPSVEGTWNVYRTYAGEPERGPDAAAWSSSPDGGGVRMELLCSTAVLPGGHMAIAGEISPDAEVALWDPTAAWTGAVSGETMTGIFTDPHGAGTWRAEKVAEAQCATYEVWGGTTDLGCGSPADPALNGYALLGVATGTRTFAGTYPWYYVLTRDRNVVQVDSVETTAGTYPGTESTSNVSAYWELAGAPDGEACTVGTGELSRGGLVRIAGTDAPASITVVVLAP
jgi:hypothetical protein